MAFSSDIIAPSLPNSQAFLVVFLSPPSPLSLHLRTPSPHPKTHRVQCKVDEQMCEIVSLLSYTIADKKKKVCKCVRVRVCGRLPIFCLMLCFCRENRKSLISSPPPNFFFFFSKAQNCHKLNKHISFPSAAPLWESRLWLNLIKCTSCTLNIV